MKKRKALGSFYTPQTLSDWIVKKILSNNVVYSVLEPSCGDGVFLSSLLSESSDLDITAIDIDKIAVDNVCSKFSNVSIYNEDFLSFETTNRFDLIIGNPPYISRKNISRNQVNMCKTIHISNGLQDKEVANIWTSFVIKSCMLLENNGILAFVLPAEFLQVKYAEEIREFIVKNFVRVEVLSFRNFRFDDTEQNTIVLIAYKTSLDTHGVFFKEINSISELNNKIIFRKSSIDSNMKWTANCLTNKELALIQKITNNENVKTIGYYCSAVAGIVTAANSYFILNKTTVAKYDLESYVKPIIQKGFFVNGNVCFDTKHFQQLQKLDIPCFLLDLSNVLENNFNNGLKKYLQIGIQQKINSRYKCLQRKRWFDVPSIWNSEGFFFKRSDKYPKMLANDCNIYITDSAYRIKMKNNNSIKNLTYSFYNTYTLLMAELMGRSYGGGVLELTPNEFKSLPIIYIDEQIDFDRFSKNFSEKKDIVDILQKNDEFILGNKLNLTKQEILILQQAYIRLKKRRIS